MRYLAGFGLLLLALRRWRVTVALQEWVWWPKEQVGNYVLNVWVRRSSQSLARHESKRSSAQLVALGAARGRFESLLANLRTDLMRGRQNGTEESNSGSTAGSSTPPAHPIRDY